MNDVSSIAQSGVEAFTTRLAVSADNIANAATENFKASKVTTSARENGGVEATLAKTADRVDISREAVEMMSTVNGFKANLKVMKSDQETTRSLLDIIT